MNNNKYVLITGATSGLGLAFAKVFSANNFNTILLARNEDKLKEISMQLEKNHDVYSIYFKCDLSKNHEIDKCIDEIIRRNLELEILINNAGTSNLGEFCNTSIKDELNIIQLNIISTTYLTKKLLPQFIAKKSGKILNVASAVGYYPLPYQAVYAASKAYMLSFSQALYSELSAKNIQVSTLCPGNIETNFLKKTGLDKLYKKTSKSAIGIDPNTLAKLAYIQFMNGKRIIYSDKSIERMIKSMKYFSQDKMTNRQYKRRKLLLEE